MIAFRAKLRTGPARALQFAIGASLAAALVTGYAAQAGGRKLDPVAAIQASLAKGLVGGAILGGEKALLDNPHDAALRAALGSAYLRAGRFQSAAVMLNDAITLGDASGRTALSLALAQIAIGHNRDALGVLAQARSAIPASDLGLAVALAGDPDHAIEMLSEAVRSESTPKARQNLAYAYALAGRWTDAKLTASADVPPDQIEARVAQWMISVQAGDAGMRVAGLLGVNPVADAGVPTALALADAPAPAVAMAAPATDASGELKAAAAPAAVIADAPAPAAPVAVAAADPAPAPAASAQATPIQGPTLTFVSNPVVQAIPAPAQAPVQAVAVTAPAPASRHAVVRTAVAPSADGSHLVQLGAFSSVANAERAKKLLASHIPGLKGHAFVVTQAEVGGRKFWRVAASGFDAGAASGTCARIRQAGGGCFAYESGRGLVGGQALAAATPHSPSLAARRR